METCFPYHIIFSLIIGLHLGRHLRYIEMLNDARVASLGIFNDNVCTTSSLVRDGYPSELQNLKFGWNFRPTALDGHSIQAISLSLDRFTIQIYGPLRMDFPSLKNLPCGWKLHPIIGHTCQLNNNGNLRPDRRILCPIKLEWSIKGYHIFRVRPHLFGRVEPFLQFCGLVGDVI